MRAQQPLGLDLPHCVQCLHVVLRQARLGAAYGVHIGQGVEELVAYQHHVEIGQVQAELGDGLATGVEHVDAHPGNVQLGVGIEGVSGWDIATLAAEYFIAAATVIVPVLGRQQVGAVVQRAHDLARQDGAEFVGDLLLEIVPGVNLHAAVRHLLGRDQRRSAVVVVAVVVRVKNRDDRLVRNLANFLRDMGPRRHIDAGVVDDQPVVALDHRAVAYPAVRRMDGPHRVVAGPVGARLFGKQFLVFEKVLRPAALHRIGIGRRRLAAGRGHHPGAACQQGGARHSGPGGGNPVGLHASTPLLESGVKGDSRTAAEPTAGSPGRNPGTGVWASWNPCRGVSPGHSYRRRSHPAIRR